MRIAIPTAGPTLDAALDPCFDHTQYLMVCSTNCRAMAHQGSLKTVTRDPGNRICTAAYVAELGVQAVIVQKIDSEALNLLRAARIAAYISDTPTARTALAAWDEGTLTRVS